MYLVEHFKRVVEGFERLLHALDRLCLHIHDDLRDYTVWIDDGQGQMANNRDKVIYALKHFSPMINLTPQETYSCPGAVGGTLQTLVLIDAVNNEKEEFKKVVHEYNTVFKANPTKPVRQVLATAGYGGVKLKQAFRHIHYIDFHPRRIAFTKTKSSSNLVINKHQAREKLLNVGKGEHIDIQLTKLSLLSEDDKLVIYRSIKPSCVVNVATYKNNNTGHSSFIRIRSSLPLFYLHDKALEFPSVSFSAKSNRNESRARSDKKIEETPYLTSISAYRYKS